MKRYRFLPITLADDFLPCVYCQRMTSWRVSADQHPVCPVCYHTKEPKKPILPLSEQETSPREDPGDGAHPCIVD